MLTDENGGRQLMFEKPFRHNSSINESIEFVSLFFCLSLNINTTFKILRLLLYNGGGWGRRTGECGGWFWGEHKMKKETSGNKKERK